MKKVLYIISAALMLAMAASCEKKLEIIPLGQTTLDNLDDLETLLNKEPQISDFGIESSALDHEMLCNNIYGWSSIASMLSNHSSMKYVMLTYDESIDRTDLVITSTFYNTLYSRINYMNVIISKAPDTAGGTPEKRAQLIAEARVLRAWYHFLLVNTYARQYDEAAASQLGGIAYVDNTNVAEQKTKLTLAEVYTRILEDCSDDVLADLIQSNVADPCRFGVDFGYGVRARVLFQMKRYDEALRYANLALGVNGRIEDRSGIASSFQWDLAEDAPNNYYLIWRTNIMNYGEYFGWAMSPDVYRLIDPNDYRMLYEYWMDNAISDFPDAMLYYGMGLVWYNVWGIRAETMYYLKAEVMIRNGSIEEGLAEIDKVRELRIDPWGFEPLAGRGASKAEAMKMLQDSKRVEFLNTYENFCDRKRWNSEPEYAESIIRDLGEYGTFELRPDSPLWVFPFPADAVNYNSSLTQNF